MLLEPHIISLEGKLSRGQPRPDKEAGEVVSVIPVELRILKKALVFSGAFVHTGQQFLTPSGAQEGDQKQTMRGEAEALVVASLQERKLKCPHFVL